MGQAGEEAGIGHGKCIMQGRHFRTVVRPLDAWEHVSEPVHLRSPGTRAVQVWSGVTASLLAFCFQVPL